jgi:hypothetical protein
MNKNAYKNAGNLSSELRNKGFHDAAYLIDLLTESNKMYVALQVKWFGYLFAAILFAFGFGIMLGVNAQ